MIDREKLADIELIYQGVITNFKESRLGWPAPVSSFQKALNLSSTTALYEYLRRGIVGSVFENVFIQRTRSESQLWCVPDEPSGIALGTLVKARSKLAGPFNLEDFCGEIKIYLARIDLDAANTILIGKEKVRPEKPPKRFKISSASWRDFNIHFSNQAREIRDRNRNP